MTENTLQKSIGEAQHALDWNQLVRWRSGYGHVEGGPAERTGDLEITVPDDATVLVDGDAVEIDGAENSVTLDPDVDYPRWAAVYVRPDGTVGVEHGDADALYPTDVDPLEARVPAPPIGVDGTLYAAVWVRANTVAISEDEVIDRRFGVEAVLETVQTLTLEAEEASVENAPDAKTDVARKAETDTLADDIGDVQGNLEDHEDSDEAHGADGPIQGAADVDAAVASHREDDIHAKPQPPVNHADDHHSGGDDELDAADLSGAMGTDEDVLVTDGEDAFWGSVPGALQESDFAFESGSWQFSDDHTPFSRDIEFENEYITGICQVSVAYDEYNGNADTPTDAAWTSWIYTDGKITGATAEGHIGQYEYTVYWSMWGIEA